MMRRYGLSTNKGLAPMAWSGAGWGNWTKWQPKCYARNDLGDVPRIVDKSDWVTQNGGREYDVP